MDGELIRLHRCFLDGRILEGPCCLDDRLKNAVFYPDSLPARVKQLQYDLSSFPRQAFFLSNEARPLDCL